jgi:hypothetical protein
MKLILVARKALEAYLISSALSRSVTRIGASIRLRGRYSSRSRRSRALGLHAEHHAIRAHEIADRRPLAQKLGVRRHVEVGFGIGLADDPRDLAGRAHGYRGLVDDHRVAGQAGGDFLGGGVDVLEVRVAVAAARRGADGDEHEVRRLRRRQPDRC